MLPPQAWWGKGREYLAGSVGSELYGEGCWKAVGWELVLWPSAEGCSQPMTILQRGSQRNKQPSLSVSVLVGCTQWEVRGQGACVCSLSKEGSRVTWRSKQKIFSPTGGSANKGYWGTVRQGKWISVDKNQHVHCHIGLIQYWSYRSP